MGKCIFKKKKSEVLQRALKEILVQPKLYNDTLVSFKTIKKPHLLYLISHVN